MTVQVSPNPVFAWFTTQGGPAVGYQLFTYIAGTSTPQATYVDYTQTTQNSNPVILNSFGYANVWLVVGLTYKLVLEDASGNLIWSVDQVPGGYNASAAVIAALLFPLTSAESAAGFTQAQLQPYPPGNLLRYGIVPNNSVVAANNQTLLAQLLNWNILSGPTGLIYSPNNGTGSPDVYYFSGGTSLIRDGITLDLNGTIWNFTKTSQTQDDLNGFLWCMRNVTIQNGQIFATYNDGGGGTYPGSFAIIAMGGRDAPVTGSSLPTIFDSQLAPFIANGQTMGDINIANLYLNGSTNIVLANNGMYGMYCFGGVNNVKVQNLTIEGNAATSPTACLVYGFYYEFGWATGSVGSSRNQRQTSHAHNWQVTNYVCRNLATSAAANSAWTMNGAYNISMEGVHGSAVPNVVAFGTGEAAFFRPWVGVDDIGALAQNGQSPLTGTAAAGRAITLKAITGRAISAGSAINLTGDSGTSGWAIANVPAWLPNTVYANNAPVYNGAFKYTAAGGGTSSNAAGFTGPVGTGTVSDGAGGTNWTSVASPYAAPGGYQGWKAATAYVINDVVTNGQYIYICTIGGTSAAASQGPTGVGTGISDGAATWSSVPSTSTTAAPANSAFPAFTDQLNYTLNGFSVDSGTTGALAGGDGLIISGGQTRVQNGKITNFGNGVLGYADCTAWSFENVDVLNCGAAGIRMGFTGSNVWTPYRNAIGSIRNCFMAGNVGQGIALIQTAAVLIENNRFGYEYIHDGINETVQTQAVNGGVTCFGITCRNNYVNVAAGGTAYALATTNSVSQGNLIDGMLGPSQTYSTPWEGVLQSATVTLTCATVGNLSITSYTANTMNYIKRSNKIDYTLEISTPAPFTWTTSSGNVLITGLPYAANNSLNSVPISSLQFGGITKAGFTQFALVGSGGSTQFTVSASGTAQAQTTCVIGDFPSGGTVKLFATGHYFTTI